MIDDGGGGVCRGSGLLLWVCGDGSGGGGQRAVGLVVQGLFSFFFLMGLWLVCGWIFAGFVVGLVSRWLLSGGDWVSVWRWCG